MAYWHTMSGALGFVADAKGDLAAASTVAGKSRGRKFRIFDVVLTRFIFLAMVWRILILAKS
jgi:hypothetical protein